MEVRPFRVIVLLFLSFKSFFVKSCTLEISIVYFAIFSYEIVGDTRLFYPFVMDWNWLFWMLATGSDTMRRWPLESPLSLMSFNSLRFCAAGLSTPGERDGRKGVLCSRSILFWGSKEFGLATGSTS